MKDFKLIIGLIFVLTMVACQSDTNTDNWSSINRNDFVWVYTGYDIEEYPVYKLKNDGTIMCESLFGYGVLYENDTHIYTSKELNTSSCSYNLSIFDGSKLLTLSEAVENKLLSEEIILNYEYPFNYDQRIKLSNIDTISKIKVTYPNENQDSIIIDIDDYLLMSIGNIHLMESVLRESDVLYTVTFLNHQDEMIHELVVHQDYVRQTKTSKIQDNGDLLWFRLEYVLQNYIDNKK